MKKPIGTVVASRDSPTPSEFKFVVIDDESKIPCRKGQFVAVESDDVDGVLIATVTNILKTNRYFESAEAVREYERSAGHLSFVFPSQRWEYILAEGKPMGRISQSGRLERVTFPPGPGDKVFLATPEMLLQVLGLDPSGVNLGKLLHHDVPVTLNLTRLFQKHVAILAISGAGKSYLTSVLIEELLMRKPDQGRVAVVILDVHGEYTPSLATASDSTKYDFSEKTTVINGPYIQLGVPKLTSYNFASFLPRMSYVQIRELNQIIKKLRSRSGKTGKPYDLNELIGMVEQSEMNPRTKEAMMGWFYDLENTRLFGVEENPSLKANIRVGEATIFDLREIISLRKKQIIVNYLINRLFNLRKRGEIPPFVFILEEAHQFCPEGPAISKGIIETIAREGRKFYASLVLISQRPVRLSTTVLSQLNSQIYLRITNPYDLQLIGQSSEMVDKASLDTITTLNVGEALIVGNAVAYPIFVQIRTRYSPSPPISIPLEDVAKRYEKKSA